MKETREYLLTYFLHKLDIDDLYISFYCRSLKQVSNRVALLKSEWNRLADHTASLDMLNDQSPGTMQESLQHQQMVQRLFIELARQQGPNVCFTEIKDEKNNIVFLGQAYSAADLTEFLRHWRVADLFSEIKIDQLVQQKNGLVQFQLHAMRNNF